MSKHNKHISMMLAVIMVLGLFTAFPAFMAVNASDTFSLDLVNEEGYAKLNISAPSKAELGDTIEVVATYTDIVCDEESATEYFGYVNFSFYFDASILRFDAVSIDGVTAGSEALTTCNNKTPGFCFSGFTILTEEAGRRISDTCVFRMVFTVIGEGTATPATFDYCNIGTSPLDEYVAFFADETTPFGWSIVVGDVNPVVTYNVTFEADGATVDTVAVEEGTAVPADKVPAVPAKEGYTGVWEAIPATITADTTIKAVYTPKTYTVTFFDKDGGVLKTETVKHGEAATAPEAPVIVGQNFTNWSVSFSAVTSDLSVYPQYNQILHTLTFTADGTTVGTANVPYGGSIAECDIPALPEKVGYTAVWSAIPEVITGDVEIKAIYTPIQYTVTFVVGDNGTSADQLVWTVDYNTASSAITLPTVVAADGYKFTGWDKELPANITEDITIIADYEVAIEKPTVNVAGDASYKGSGTANGSTDASNYGEANFNEYHTGRLNDGVIVTDATDSTKTQNVEIYNTGFGKGNTYVYFKFDEAQTIKDVYAYANCRTTGGNRGYPATFNVYVGNSEDIASATLLGAATTTDTGYVRKYTASGNATGTYVILEMEISGAVAVIALTEVEIMAEDTPVNHAPYSDYKGSGTANGSTDASNYGEANFNEYHTGRLNDGVIVTDATDSTKTQNVEIYNTGFGKGNTYVYFKFDEAQTIKDVYAYANCRTTGGNRGYPATFNVYVGNSEDIASATLLGAATTTDTGYVRKYTASGNATGTYVILEMEISGAVAVIALTEVEIMAYGEIPVPVIPSLEAPVLSGNLTKLETYEAPTVTWNAVEGATGYDVYIDGVKVAENITETTYTTTMAPSVTYGSNTGYTKLQVIAKGDGVASSDSAMSESYNFFYVDMPVDLRGNKVSSADIIIDPGHGGSAPGASSGTRLEKDDTLAMSLKLGEMFEGLGYTVAFTRIEDKDVGLMARAAMANAGDFKAFICVHRNSYSTTAPNGIETLYETGDALDQAFARIVQDEMMALGVFTNRDLKPRDNLVVTNNTSDSIPTILVELAFMSNDDDNTKFDAYNDDLAFAIVKGTMKQLGAKTGFEGTANINGTEIAINGSAVTTNVTLTNYDENNCVIKIDFTLANAFGINDVLMSTDGGLTWLSVGSRLSIEDSTIEGYAKQIKFSDTDSAFGIDAGVYTVQYKIVHNREAYTIYTAEDVVLTVNLTVEPNPIEKGDINADGSVDNIDASLALRYDAGIIDLTDDQLAIGDVNGDGEVNNIDAALILKFDAGIIENF